MTRPVVELACEFTYEAAHSLPHVPDGHKCGRTHGHTYHLTVVVRGPVRDDGFVCDFDHIKLMTDPFIKMLDHHHLNEIEGLDNPTVEHQLVWWWGRLVDILPLEELRLRETGKHSGIYRGEIR